MDESRFPHEVPECFDCSICLSVAENPVEHNSCQTIFCSGCVKDLNRCPHCRETIGIGSTFGKMNRHLLQQYNELQIYCVHFPRCSEITSIERMKLHEDQCKYTEINCTQYGCKHRCSTLNMAKHEQECPRRKVSCPHCKNPFIYAFRLDSHILKCSPAPNHYGTSQRSMQARATSPSARQGTVPSNPTTRRRAPQLVTAATAAQLLAAVIAPTGNRNATAPSAERSNMYGPRPYPPRTSQPPHQSSMQAYYPAIPYPFPSQHPPNIFFGPSSHLPPPPQWSAAPYQQRGGAMSSRSYDDRDYHGRDIQSNHPW